MCEVSSSQSSEIPRIPIIGNGDIFSYTDFEERVKGKDGVLSQTAMLGRGALIKPWLPTEVNLYMMQTMPSTTVALLLALSLVSLPLYLSLSSEQIKERRHWDISASERLDILKDFVKFGLEHWGSDQQGVDNTRRFLLEWLSFLYRYVPVGLLEVVPQQMNHRPPNHMIGRSDLETLFLSDHCADWIKITEMLLGPVPDGFKFEPKHKARGYAED